MKSFHTILKQKRRERGLTQTQVAELLDIMKRQVIRYENGELFPPHETIKKLNLIFDYPFHRHIYNDNEPDQLKRKLEKHNGSVAKR